MLREFTQWRRLSVNEMSISESFFVEYHNGFKSCANCLQAEMRTFETSEFGC